MYWVDVVIRVYWVDVVVRVCTGWMLGFLTGSYVVC